jgi:hypothetical protein
MSTALQLADEWTGEHHKGFGGRADAILNLTNNRCQPEDSERYNYKQHVVSLNHRKRERYHTYVQYHLVIHVKYFLLSLYKASRHGRPPAHHPP